MLTNTYSKTRDIIDSAPIKNFGKVIKNIAAKDNTAIVLTADVKSSTGLHEFADTFPERFFNVGVAEQNMLGISAGLAACGLKPFAACFSAFASMRACEQVRTDICYPKLNVKIIATHAGISFGPGGTTHHATEDIAIMRSLANMTVLVPADNIETAKIIEKASDYNGPCFIRLPRGKRPDIYKIYEDCRFEIGKADTLRDGDDITIIACGMPVYESIKAADILGKEGIDVRIINMSTVKPINEYVIMKAAKETRAILTVEEHNIKGGLGSAVAEVIVQTCPVPMKILGLPDIFSTIGPSDELYNLYGLNAGGIADTVRYMLKN
jgi:transketolase